VGTICTVVLPDGSPCGRPAKARGWCTRCYQRWKAHGDPTVVTKQEPWPDRICTIGGCGQPRTTSKLYCEKHRGRVRRYGDPSITLKDHTPAVERWKTQHEVDDSTGCWNWTGPIYKGQGHGFIQEGAKKRHMAHRFVWEQIAGPIPKGLVLDHLCKNKRCVNPEHLEAVTQGVNAFRGGTDGGNAAKTHCKHGHGFTPENTYIRVNGWRGCRACQRRLMRVKKYRYAYIYLYQPDHPIADVSGKVMEHRMVLYDAIGTGPHACHWGCGREGLTWGGIRGIHVDHLDGDPSDNRLENLVPSCQSCNKSRAKAGNPTDWCPPTGVSVPG
jgi:hypothetical protein